MPYLPTTAEDRQAMLEAIGAGSLEELFAPIPADLRLQRPLDVPPAQGELALTTHFRDLCGQNRAAGQSVCFLGGGSYDHFVPAVVDVVAGRSEFYTAYTPYQPEASQGTLQAIFEYQTLIAQLTGMDVSNASLYDGAGAAAEAVLMSLGATQRFDKVVVAGSVHPEYRQVLATYLTNLSVEIHTVAVPEGAVSMERLAAAVDERTACVLIQHPNFFGCLEDVRQAAEIAHRAGALLVVAVDPMSLGVLARPGDYGADIVVAEGQSLGTPMSFGGPYLGILACREQFLRRMPGRLVGQTVDRRGRRCWVLTLQTREQHIRREKATSNICTNQGLLALRATAYLAAMGPQGMRSLGELCLQKAHYCRDRVTAGGKLRPAFDQPFFKEFVVRCDADPEDVVRRALEQDIFAGVPLGRWYPELADCLLIAVTEKRTREEIDQLAALFGTLA